MHRLISVAGLVVLVLAGLGTTTPGFHSASRRANMQRGVSWVAGASVSSEDIQPLVENHVNRIVQTPFGWQENWNSPVVSLVTDGGIYWGEKDLGITTTAELARAAGIKTLLKPHIWLSNMRGGKWRGEIAMDTEADWRSWFDSYEKFILHYAHLAEKNQIEALCVGTELRLTASLREQDWREVIRKVRSVFSGRLTYAANWYLEFEEVKFWDALDFIGIQAYFPLSDTTSPSLNELIEGWMPYKATIDSISTAYNRPVVFTEVGYKSSIDTAIEPWEWPTHPLQPADEADLETQATCYEAFFQTFWNEDWCEGAYFWKWFPRVRHPDKFYRNFTPQHKPAQEVMAKWYRNTAD